MDLRRLSFFLAVAEHGNFTRAAEAIYVSQPAVSLAVKELERELGTALFYRLGRQVTLTAAGEALVEPARRALREVEIGSAAVAAVTGLAAGRVDLCCLPTLAAHPVAELVGRFRRSHPAVAVDIAAADDPADLVGLLRGGRCEIGVTEAAAIPSDLRHRVLMEQALVVVLPPGTASHTRPISLSRLRDTPIVTTPAGTSARRLLDQAFTAAGVQPDVVVVTAQREALLPLVLAGAGAALLPEPIARQAADRGAVIARPSPAITRTVVLAHRPGPLAPAAAAFVELSAPKARTRRQRNP
jgi:LysR family transcriptional regulator, carnitine catabolism transcriptional activator